MKVKGNSYLVRFPITPDKTKAVLNRIAHNKIVRRLERKSPVKITGRPRKYKYESHSEAQHIYYEAFKAKLRGQAIPVVG